MRVNFKEEERETGRGRERETGRGREREKGRGRERERERERRIYIFCFLRDDIRI